MDWTLVVGVALVLWGGVGWYYAIEWKDRAKTDDGGDE